MKYFTFLVIFFAYAISVSSMAADSTSEGETSRAPTAIGLCTGYGGLKDLVFWGPIGNSCNGLTEWGSYQKKEPISDQLCLCRGKQRNINGVGLWGPKGEFCAGWAGAGVYSEQCVVIKKTEIASCVGRGGISGMRLYGPKGMECAGIKNWGVYE